MLWLDAEIDRQLRSQIDRQPPAWRWLKARWRFSQFYGDYQSRAPHQRRRFAIDSENNPACPHAGATNWAPAKQLDIQQRCDRTGRTFFQVIDYRRRDRLTFYSETNLNLWLQQRHYPDQEN